MLDRHNTCFFQPIIQIFWLLPITLNYQNKSTKSSYYKNKLTQWHFWYFEWKGLKHLTYWYQFVLDNKCYNKHFLLFDFFSHWTCLVYKMSVDRCDIPHLYHWSTAYRNSKTSLFASSSWFLETGLIDYVEQFSAFSISVDRLIVAALYEPPKLSISCKSVE